MQHCLLWAVLMVRPEEDFRGVLDWKGKCLDLEKAYRQVPVSSSSLAYSVALVHHLQGKPKYFLSQSLPFGACSSVYAFNRIGAALRFLIQHVLKGVLTVFYDDFPFLETTVRVLNLWKP